MAYDGYISHLGDICGTVEPSPQIELLSDWRPMISNAELSELLATLYSAPLEPDNWQLFLQRLCVLTECSMGVLLTNSSQGNQALAGGGINLDPEPIRLYNSHYGSQDPFQQALMQNPRIGVIPSEELVRREDLVRTEFYNEVLDPFDLQYLTVTPCLFTAGLVDCISFWRGGRQGAMDGASVNLLKILLPHMHNALQLHHSVETANLRGRSLQAVTEQFQTAAFVLGRTGRVLYMNPEAEMMVRSGNVLSLKQNYLRTQEHAENVRLSALIANSIGASQSSSGGAKGLGSAMLVSRASSRPPLRLVALPFAVEGSIGCDRPCVIIFVSDPSTRMKPRGKVLRTLYGLTPAEARVADRLAEGHDVKTVASHLGITLETTRFHLKRVLSKTGTHRQTELMRLVLSLPGVQ